MAWIVIEWNEMETIGMEWNRMEMHVYHEFLNGTYSFFSIDLRNYLVL